MCDKSSFRPSNEPNPAWELYEEYLRRFKKRMEKDVADKDTDRRE